VTANAAFLKKFFPGVFCRVYDCSKPIPENFLNEESDPYCKYEDHMLQLFTSSLFLAGMVSSIVAGWVTRRAGRRATMAAAGVMFCAGAALTAGAQAVSMLVVGRILLGCGVGFANQAVPLYLSEMAPTHLRGALNIMFQLATTLGILVAQLVNWTVLDKGRHGWRASLAGAGVPAVILLVGAACLPDTPASLLARGYPEKARAVLQRVRGAGYDIGPEMEDIAEGVAATEAAEAVGRGAIFRRQYRPELVAVIAAPVFQQLTGINSIMFYAPVLFGTLGSGQGAALLQTVIVGVVNVLATLIAVFLVDRAGRRPLLITGGVVMAAAQFAMGGVLGVLFRGGRSSTALSPAAAIGTIFVVCVYIAAFAWSWGPLGWLLPSEVQPMETRSFGMALSVCVNLLFTFIMGQAFLSMLCGLKWGIFVFFGACVVVMTLYSWLLLPETRGVPIEEMGRLWRRHWFWRRVVGGSGGHGGVEGGKGGSGADGGGGGGGGSPTAAVAK
jgi:MFS transporter, SP family, sugar:H+ symporter